MPFVHNASQIAQDELKNISVSLAEKYQNLIIFLSKYPTMAASLRGKNAPMIGSREYIQKQASNFANARSPRAPQAPSTTPDEMVSVILQEHFCIREEELKRVKEQHLLSMGAENFVGELLERYLASVLELHGWIWSSGAVVKSVDFIKPPAKRGRNWRMLQVKNRDNSENSSSSSVRHGTEIEKWFRTFSRREETNWGNFPDEKLRAKLSEENFKNFVREYLRSLKTK